MCYSHYFDASLPDFIFIFQIPIMRLSTDITAYKAMHLAESDLAQRQRFSAAVASRPAIGLMLLQVCHRSLISRMRSVVQCNVAATVNAVGYAASRSVIVFHKRAGNEGSSCQHGGVRYRAGVNHTWSTGRTDYTMIISTR